MVNTSSILTSVVILSIQRIYTDLYMYDEKLRKGVEEAASRMEALLRASVSKKGIDMDKVELVLDQRTAENGSLEWYVALAQTVSGTNPLDALFFVAGCITISTMPRAVSSGSMTSPTQLSYGSPKEKNDLRI